MIKSASLVLLHLSKLIPNRKPLKLLFHFLAYFPPRPLNNWLDVIIQAQFKCCSLWPPFKIYNPLSSLYPVIILFSHLLSSKRGGFFLVYQVFPVPIQSMERAGTRNYLWNGRREGSREDGKRTDRRGGTCQTWWDLPIIPDIQKVEAAGFQVQGLPG